MRLVNRFLALVLGTALAVGAIVVVVEIVLGLTDNDAVFIGRRSWDRELSGLSWDEDWLVITLIVMGVVGVLLVIYETLPRRPDTLAATSDRGGVDLVYGRRGVERELRSVVLDQPAVLDARVHRRKRRVRVRARLASRSSGDEIDDTGTAIRDEVRSALARLGLQRDPDVKVRIEPAKGRVQ